MSALSRSSPGSRRKRWLLLMLPFGLLLTGAWLCRPFNPDREFGLAAPALPSPNAHDLLIQAASQIRPAPVTASMDTDALGRSKVAATAKVYPLGPKKLWLQQYQAGFKSFDDAQKAIYRLPREREPQPGGDLDYPAELRWLARALAVEVEVLAEEKQSEAAANRALDIWKLGLDMENGAHLTAVLNAIAVESLARAALNPEIANLSGPQAARTAKRLETLLSQRLPLAQIWNEERAAFLWQLKPHLEQANYDQWRESQYEKYAARGEAMPSYQSPAPTLNGPLVNWTIRRQAAQFSRGIDFLVADSLTTWPKRQTTLPEVSGPNPAMQRLITVLSRYRFSHARAQTQGQIFLARLALHAFRKDTGAYPTKLEELAPKYLKQAPLDLFSDGQPLRYRREGKRYKLWSLGPDARDDGAKPIENPAATRPNARFASKEDSLGDIVANVNN